MNFSTQTKKAGFIQPQPRCPFRSWIGMLFCCLCVFFLTVKLFYTMKLIYFEKSFISVFGFIIPSFFQFCKDHRAEKISHTETYLLCLTAKKPCVTGIFEKEKERKLQYQWYHNFRSYLVWVSIVDLSVADLRRLTSQSDTKLCLSAMFTIFKDRFIT